MRASNITIGVVYLEQDGTKKETEGFLFWKKTKDVPNLVKRYSWFSKYIEKIPPHVKSINVNPFGAVEIRQIIAHPIHFEYFLGNQGISMSWDEEVSYISYMSKSEFDETRIILLNDGFKEE